MAIGFVGGSSNTAASATTVSATYSPTAGNIIIVYVPVGASVTAISVADQNGNALAPGPVVSSSQQPVAAGTGFLYGFWGIAQAGATSYTATWTTSRVSSIVLGEYSGVQAINLALATNSATGTSATATITPTTTDANDWLVCGMANNSTDGFTAIAGSNLRESTSGVTACAALVDSGVVAVAGATTVKATIAASVAWGAFAIQLRPFAGGAPATAVPEGLNSLLGGMALIKSPYPGTGNLQAGTGLIYGNVLEPYGQMWPRFS